MIALALQDMHHLGRMVRKGHLVGCGRLGPIRLHLVIFSDVATTAIFIWKLHYAVHTHS